MGPHITPMVLASRIAMFVSMLIVIVYLLHFILPSSSTVEQGDIALNPWIQIGLSIALGLFGALIGFWITFGDLVNRGEK